YSSGHWVPLSHSVGCLYGWNWVYPYQFAQYLELIRRRVSPEVEARRTLYVLCLNNDSLIGTNKIQLEFIFPKPKFLTTCIYGIAFILLGNISGNAIAFARYAMEAAGHDEPDSEKGKVIGIAFAALTAAVLLHVCSRRGGIVMNNAFACLKVLILLTIIILGFVK